MEFKINLYFTGNEIRDQLLYLIFQSSDSMPQGVSRQPSLSAITAAQVAAALASAAQGV